ncbi:MAG: toll/interleukin-1 receptor domain-containing protein [Chloroflexota bacterium]
MAEIRKLRVFLCHSKVDKQKVHDLYDRLIADGFDIWFDEEKLVPGQDWGLEIRRAISETDVVIACLSSQSVNKAGYAQKEIVLALDVADEQPEGAIFIIPTRFDNCEMPDRLRKRQWVSLFDNTGYENLKEALLIRARSLDIPDDDQLIREWLAEIVCQKYNKPADVADKIISHLDVYDSEFVTRAQNFYLSEFVLKNRTSMLRYAMLVAVRLITKVYELKEQHKSPENIRRFLLEQGNILFGAASNDFWGYYPKDYVMGIADYGVKDRKLPMFDEYDGGLAFSPFLFEMTLGLGTPVEVGVALDLIDSAIEEINHGQVLSNYEFIFTASLKVAEILRENQQHYWANLRICHAAALYDKYPQQTKKYFDLQCEVGEPELVLGIEVYKRIGLGFPSNEKTGKAITYLTNITNELKEKGVSRIRRLTHDLIGLCYLDLAQCLESRGGHEQALFIIKVLHDNPIYTHLSETIKEVVREIEETGLPTQYPIFESVLKKQELKKRSSQNLAANETNTPKQLFDRWNQVTKSLPIEIKADLDDAARPMINFVHSATFSLEISRAISTEQALGNMMGVTKDITAFSLVFFFAGLESQYHESKGHSVRDGQISEEQFLNLKKQASIPIANYLIGLMKIFFQNTKALKELESKTNISTEQQYIVALTDAVTDVSDQIFELGKKYFRETENIERFRQI